MPLSLLIVPNKVFSWWEYQLSLHEKMSCEDSGLERGQAILVSSVSAVVTSWTPPAFNRTV